MQNDAPHFFYNYKPFDFVSPFKRQSSLTLPTQAEVSKLDFVQY